MESRIYAPYINIIGHIFVFVKSFKIFNINGGYKMQTTAIKEELKKVFEGLNEYELLSIDEVNRSKKRTFYSDGIIVYHKNYYDIGFSRTFADTIVPECLINEICVNDNVVIIKCGFVKYSIVPLKRKMHLIEKVTLPDSIYIDTLINHLYFNVDRIIVRHNVVCTPLDLNKLGKMSLKQKTTIKRIIESKLDGSQVKYQCCRVPAFSVEFYDDEYIVCGHIYDYAKNYCLNRVELYKSSEDFNNINPYKEYVKYVDSFRR